MSEKNENIPVLPDGIRRLMENDGIKENKVSKKVTSLSENNIEDSRKQNYIESLKDNLKILSERKSKKKPIYIDEDVKLFLDNLRLIPEMGRPSVAALVSAIICKSLNENKIEINNLMKEIYKPIL